MESEVLALVLTAACAVFGRDVHPDDDFFSVGGDSVTGVEFVLRLEADLGTEIEVDEILAAENFSAFAAALSERLRGSDHANSTLSSSPAGN